LQLLPSGILIIGHISVTNEHICVKFGVQADIGHTRITVAQYIPLLIKFKMAAATILDLYF